MKLLTDAVVPSGDSPSSPLKDAVPAEEMHNSTDQSAGDPAASAAVDTPQPTPDVAQAKQTSETPVVNAAEDVEAVKTGDESSSTTIMNAGGDDSASVTAEPQSDNNANLKSLTDSPSPTKELYSR